ncbi:MAG TPA: universal stress protein [Thermoleophilaceae bacterium]|nr:universal stress protein [Thermoleophilaceae bacterium]
MSIVVGYDGRPEGRDALVLGASLARALHEPLLVASVFPSPETALGLTAVELRAEAERTAAEGLAELPEDVEATDAVVPGRSAAQGLHDLAETEQPGAVVVGSSHRGRLGRVLAGTAASGLLATSPCPVAVAPRGLARQGGAPLRSIGVGFDDSPESWNAVQRAAALGVATGATLRVIHALLPIVAPPMAPEETERLTSELRVRRELALNRAAASVSKDLHAHGRLVVGDPVRVLESEARDGLDPLVLGSRGYRPLQRVLLESVSSELVRLAPCPVMVVPRSVEFDPSAGGMAARDAVTP